MTRLAHDSFGLRRWDEDLGFRLSVGYDAEASFYQAEHSNQVQTFITLGYGNILVFQIGESSCYCFKVVALFRTASPSFPVRIPPFEPPES